MSKRILAVSLGILLMLGTFVEITPALARRGADDSLERSDDRGRGSEQGQREFFGAVAQLPQKEYLGVWVIDGKEVHVTPQTELDFRGGPVAVGTVVKVEGGTVEGKYIAREIKTRQRK
jgi:hypothetical protein